ncbi:MAG TPA: hypothetical protein VJM48_13340 [Methylibium sp.]|nr:hypothetical protein [Methylibium sp.]
MMTPTPMSRRRSLTTLAAGGLLALAPYAALAVDPSQFSKAEKLVFTDNHMANVKAPSGLRYSFAKSGALEAGFQDEVLVELDRSRKVQGSFLTGERKERLPDIELPEANPVILYFLEHDIREMERLTKGKSAYFRKRIRMAMVDEAQVRDTTVSLNGRTLPAQEVTLTPYQSDPARSRYERFANKRYTFTLAKDVPGGVYQIRTVMSGATAADPVMIDEVMTFTGTTAGAAAATTTSR